MLDIIPIGGVKEIGMNMFILRCNGFNICIDAGVIFPSSQYFGIESIMPDYDDLVSKIGDINFLFVTHGHEDHIGGYRIYFWDFSSYMLHHMPKS